MICETQDEVHEIENASMRIVTYHGRACRERVGRICSRTPAKGIEGNRDTRTLTRGISSHGVKGEGLNTISTVQHDRRRGAWVGRFRTEPRRKLLIKVIQLQAGTSVI